MAEQGFKGPIVQPFVAVPAPVLISTDVLRVADCYRLNTPVSTLRYNIFRQSV